MSNKHYLYANDYRFLENLAHFCYNVQDFMLREVKHLHNTEFLTITCNRQKVSLDIRTIIYINMHENVADIRTADGRSYKTHITLEKLENSLGDRFIRPHRSRLVSVTAIHDITDKIELNNGERLDYVARRKRDLMAELRAKRAQLLDNLGSDAQPAINDKLHEYYRCFDSLPVAFTDIEMVMDERKNAVDWIFRYANPALAQLEKRPLAQLIGHSFRSVFPNMDSKWLKSYERAAIYGETLELIDHSPEIDAYLKIICFPTIPGHCGCMLFDIGQMQFADNGGDAHNAKLRYFANMLKHLI